MMPDNLHNSYTQQFVKWGVFHTTEGLKKEYEQKPSSQHYQNENRVCKSRKIHVVHVLLFKYAQKFEIDLSVHFIWFRYFNSEKRCMFRTLRHFSIGKFDKNAMSVYSTMYYHFCL